MKQMKRPPISLKYHFKSISFARLIICIICAVKAHALIAQNTLPLADLSFFQSPGPSWKLAGNVRGSITQKEVLTTSSGVGFLVNIPATTSKKSASAKGNTADESTADAGAKKSAIQPAAAKQAKAPAYDDVKNLLQKNTCLACHNPNTRQVGPAYKDVAKRKYTVAQIVELIHNPKPEHWPDYSTPMPPMPQVPNEEARKIAEWIKSLEKAK